MYKVSMIIPVYKVEEYIERCVRSVIAQTYREDWECIFVDDCSPDHSVEIIAETISSYTGNITFRIVRHERNKGLSEARNTGIQVAKGDYLYFLDSDDAIAENCIEKLMRLAETYRPDFVIGNMAMIQGEQSVACLGNVKHENIEGNEKICRAYVNQVWYAMGCNKLMSKEFLLKHQLFFYPGIYHEDELWSFRLASVSERMAICTDMTYFYYKRETSIMGTFTEKHIDDLLRVTENMARTLVVTRNRFLQVKLRTVSLFFIFRLLDSNYDLEFKRKIMKKLKSGIIHQIRYMPPVGLKDAVRGLVLILPVRMSMIYSRILKKTFL